MICRKFVIAGTIALAVGVMALTAFLISHTAAGQQPPPVVQKSKSSAKVGEIMIVGNDKTPNSVIWHHLAGILPGQDIDEKALRAAEESLAASKLFVVDPQRGIRPTVTTLDRAENNNGYKDILVTVQEKAADAIVPPKVGAVARLTISADTSCNIRAIKSDSGPIVRIETKAMVFEGTRVDVAYNGKTLEVSLEENGARVEVTSGVGRETMRVGWGSAVSWDGKNER